MRRVLATLSPSRNRVLNKRIVGNVDKSLDSLMFIVTINSRTADVMFNASRRSSISAGIGVISVTISPNTPSPRRTSE